MKSSALGMLSTEQIFPKHCGINLSLKNKSAAGECWVAGLWESGEGVGEYLFSTLGRAS